MIVKKQCPSCRLRAALNTPGAASLDMLYGGVAGVTPGSVDVGGVAGSGHGLKRGRASSLRASSVDSLLHSEK